eukprot:9078215-Karenia_brevis.AAC.1
MGGAAQGDFTCSLGPMQKRIESARERLEKAAELACRIKEFIDGSADKASLHEAWILATKCVKEALSYDIRIIPSDVLGPILARHHCIMKEVASAILGSEMSETSWARLQLPGPLGGAGITLPETSADAAFVSTWQAVTNRVSIVSAALGRATD